MCRVNGPVLFSLDYMLVIWILKFTDYSCIDLRIARHLFSPDHYLIHGFTHLSYSYDDFFSSDYYPIHRYTHYPQKYGDFFSPAHFPKYLFTKLI